MAPNTMGDPLERKMIFRRGEAEEPNAGDATPLADPPKAWEQDVTTDPEPFGRDIA